LSHPSNHFYLRDARHAFWRTPSVAVVGAIAIALLLLLSALWMSDDAAITLRTVLNVVNGFGARFNLDERVQAYTHPLWFLLISGTT
jgi:arabinofuranosyltransferase